jgi:hypothetical protein
MTLHLNDLFTISICVKGVPEAPVKGVPEAPVKGVPEAPIIWATARQDVTPTSRTLIIKQSVLFVALYLFSSPIVLEQEY